MDKLVRITASILASPDLNEDEIEQKVLELSNDALLARRLIDWIPEIFGYVMILRGYEISPPDKFFAKNKSGEWEAFEFKLEPCLEPAFRLASELFYAEDKEAFNRIFCLSSTFGLLKQVLEAGGEVKDTEFKALTMVGIPAEFYRSKKKSWLRSLFNF